MIEDEDTASAAGNRPFSTLSAAERAIAADD